MMSLKSSSQKTLLNQYRNLYLLPQLILKKGDLVISPEELSPFATFGMRYIDDIFDIGYNSTIKKLNEHDYIKQGTV
tara:strand:+ start:1953 stop:2183 length:231 start_codon:yes stop_codon:yes gene_type:complete